MWEHEGITNTTSKKKDFKFTEKLIEQQTHQRRRNGENITLKTCHRKMYVPATNEIVINFQMMSNLE